MEKEANIIKLLASPNNLQNSIVIENKNYHIYVINSEEIKEGDWYMYCHFGEWIISNSRETLKKGTNTLENLNKDDYFKKIIATTDKSLEIPCQVECHDCNGKGEQIIPYQDKGYICSRCLGTGLEDNEKPLPRPSDDFIKAFVKAQGKIDKILVEYEDKGEMIAENYIDNNYPNYLNTKERVAAIEYTLNNLI